MAAAVGNESHDLRPMSYSPPTKPNPVVRLLRLPWVAFLVVMVLWAAFALYLSFRWWMVVPLLLVLGATFVLLRNRARRR